MKKLRILVCHAGTLLGQGVESVLALHDGLEVSTLSFTDAATLIGCIRALRPNVVVMDEGGRLPGVARLAAELLDEFADLRMVAIDHEANLVRVVQTREVRLARSADLIRVLKASQLDWTEGTR